MLGWEYVGEDSKDRVVRVRSRGQVMGGTFARTAREKSLCDALQNVQWFRGGLAFEAHRLLYHSALISLSLRLKDLLGPVTGVKKRKREVGGTLARTAREKSVLSCGLVVLHRNVQRFRGGLVFRLIDCCTS